MARERIPRKRLILYAALLLAMLLANLVVYQLRPAAIIGPQAAPATVTASDLSLASLSVSRGLSETPRPLGRDLFRRVEPPPPPKPPAPAPTPRAAPPKPDPDAIARAAAQRLLDQITVLGILGSRENPIAIVQFGGDVRNAVAGDEITPGFKIKTLTLTHMVVRNDRLEMEELFVLNGQEAN